MRISDFGGEEALIRLIARNFGSPADSSLIKAIGDDTAVILAGDRAMLVTCDMLIEGTHFRRGMIEPYDLGWKSVAVNISDIAAMGGTPTYTLISLGVQDREVAEIEESYRGIVDAASRFGSKLIGGDTCFSTAGMVYSVFQLGLADPDRVLYRSGARPGDAIMVTGTLGDSRTGLELLLKHGLAEAERMSEHAVAAHLRPMPRIPEGALLARLGVTSCMDVSDGLACDLPKLCEASGVGAVVRLDSIPAGPATCRFAPELGWDAERLAADGGEDYELLFTVASERADEVRSAFAEGNPTPVAEIGVITEGHGAVLALPNGSTVPFHGGWQHFPGGAAE